MVLELVLGLVFKMAFAFLALGDIYLCNIITMALYILNSRSLKIPSIPKRKYD